MGPETWLEVVRRYLFTWQDDNSEGRELVQDDDSEGRELVQLLLVLGSREVEQVSKAQHARLLRLLVDEVLGCEEIREVSRGAMAVGSSNL